MTRSDQWKERDCVMDYRAFCDEARLAATGQPFTYLNHKQFLGYFAFAHIAMPESWSAKKKKEMAGRLHQQKPDKDNIEKALTDALFAQDSTLAIGGVMAKYWLEEDAEPRIDVFLIPIPGEEEIKFLHAEGTQ
jgi:hypothetical protein